MASETKATLDHAKGAAASGVTESSSALHDGSHLKWSTINSDVSEVLPYVGKARQGDAMLSDVEWLRPEINRAGEPKETKRSTGQQRK